HPKVLLLDEPLGALDAFTRMRMQDEVLRLWENRRTTTLLVTHDIDEAIYMSDRIMVMTARPGRIDRMIANALARPGDRSSSEFFFSAQIFSNFFTSPVARRTRTALEIPNECRWSAREHATQQTRSPRSTMNSG